MAASRDHVDEALQELIDGRLPPAERQDVEAHLAACPRCRRLRASLEQARQALRSTAAGDAPAPSALQERILAALDAEDQSRAAVSPINLPIKRRGRNAPWVWAAAAALVLAAGALWLIAPGARGAVDTVAAEYDRLAAGELAVEHAAAAPAELERYFAARGLSFHPRVLDLAMMGFEIVGGRVSRVGREPSAVMVYRSANAAPADPLVCQMYRGRLADLPRADEVQRRGGFSFHLFRRGASTLVFWQEGELVCVLVGRGDPAALLDLAAAKAMLAPRAGIPL